ncbi:AMP-binding protein [Gordonia bronchialis]|nr:AMP-binding protein [Gordonia bronchialis]
MHRWGPSGNRCRATRRTHQRTIRGSHRSRRPYSPPVPADSPVRLEAGDAPVVLGFASPSFDASVLEYLLATTNGGTVVYRPAEALGGPPLAEFMARQRVTHTFLTPSVLANARPVEAAVPAFAGGRRRARGPGCGRYLGAAHFGPKSVRPHRDHHRCHYRQRADARRPGPPGLAGERGATDGARRAAAPRARRRAGRVVCERTGVVARVSGPPRPHRFAFRRGRVRS